MKILEEKPRIINVGLRSFYDSLRAQGADAVHVEWSPPAGGDLEIARLLTDLDRPEIGSANLQAVEKILDSKPVLVDVKPAIEVVPKMSELTILHSGPPLEWKRMCGPMRGAVIGALLYEGLAKDEKEAENLAASEKMEFSPCHHHNAVGPMAGLISPSMPVFVVENQVQKNRSYCTINEGLGKVLRFGAYDKEVLNKLSWIRDVLGPSLGAALRQSKGIDLKVLISQALQMGDECHNRNAAGTSLFLNEIMPYLLGSDLGKKTINDVVRFISGNRQFFLNLSMPACKVTLDAMRGIKNCTLVSAMARNGVEFGIQVSGLEDRWFTAGAEVPRGLYFPGYGDIDANPDLGDSSITETAGLGGFAMATAPAIVQFIGGTYEDAVNYTQEMYEITLTENKSFALPNLRFRGTPTGIDLRKVLDTNIMPIINTGIAHRQAGIGQIGAGILRAPLGCFKKALVSMSRDY
jgi:hypothetical protein